MFIRGEIETLLGSMTTRDCSAAPDTIRVAYPSAMVLRVVLAVQQHTHPMTLRKAESLATA